MIILQIEHPVPNYDGWKKAFDSDPLKRAESGVISHRVSRLTDNPNYVIIELGFLKYKDAETMLERLKELWKQVDGKVMMNPKSRVIEVIEQKNY
jgi:hypothetical protein